MRVAAFGELCLHISLHPAAIGGAGRGSQFEPCRIDLEVGGSAHYIASQLDLDQNDSVAVGIAGLDGAGSWVRQAVAAWHPARSRVLVVECPYRTGRLLLEQGGKDRLTIRVDVSAGTSSILAEHAHLAAGADYAHMSCFPGSDPLRQALLSTGVPIVADFGYLPWLGDAERLASWTRQRLEGVAVAVFNGAEAPAPTVKLARYAVARGVTAALVTFGSTGALICTADGMVRQPAFQVAVTNPVGAGDTLVAAFLHSWHRGDGPEAALRCGQRAAATHISSRPHGSGAGPRTRDDG